MFYRLQKAENKAFLSSRPLCNDAPLFELPVGNNNHHFEWRKGGRGMDCFVLRSYPYLRTVSQQFCHRVWILENFPQMEAFEA